ncbi:uncharacterized protein [Physcomitrium patens]|uniref:Uncharacterized protein n=1 Tax=Physcomitrium patens TaxID=3218 RepID=A0A2K1JKN6_PHYPA|nr:uncharacterized protein LOC112290865 isoform X2 [Physcomitrium patens]PNR42118.1 hypothetical protein PHYPA_016947 [Physcomitrium patens]|eukprot:XP_024393430.1 uncharacterized protein LOC112290865 isoform X2 [Physcomitrella patens]
MLSKLEFEQQQDEGRLIWEASKSVASLPPLGRVLSAVFNAEWRSVEKALCSHDVRAQQGSVGRALISLLGHVENGLTSGGSLEQMFCPMLEHMVKSKDQGNRKKIVGIFRWTFAETKHGLLLATSLAAIVGSLKVDHRVKLGWCILVRELVEREFVLYRSSPNGQTDEELTGLVTPLMCFSKCVHPLVRIACNESSKQGKQKAPTRLTMAAADCVTVITKGLISDPPVTPTKSTPDKLEKNEERVLVSPTSRSSNASGRVSFISEEAKASTSGRETENVLKEQGARALWDSLDDIILLVTELQEWNEQARPLHARGLRQVLMRLNHLANYRESLETRSKDAGSIQVGVSVLAACWRQYSSLILLEDRNLVLNPDPVIQHWFGALQYWTQAAQEMDATVTRRADEMRGYALTCLALTLGRLDPRRLEEVLKDIEPDLLQSLMSQVREANIEVVDMAMAILRSLLFRSSGVNSKMEEIVPVLMDMLDTRDSAARAVVHLVAEFLASNPTSPELEKVLARLDSEDPLQRRNGLDVLTELVAVSTKSKDTVDTPLSRTIAAHLFDRLGDEELTNRVEASALFAKLDPTFTLAQLVRLVYSPDARKRSAASSAVQAVLCNHVDQCRTVTVLLDCIRDLMAEVASADRTRGSSKGGDSLDLDRVLGLVATWASKVQDWELLIEVLLDKMYKEASNPVIPRFLSHISGQLADLPHLVFPQIHQRMHDQPRMSEEVLSNISKNEDALAELLFQRLSPLLVLRILPLKAFNHSSSKDLYGGMLDEAISGESQDQGRISTITGLLLERMCNVWELDDVRKIAAELTGRLLPNAMLSAVSAALEEAAHNVNTVTAKACLFSLCTSLMIRGKETLEHPLLAQVRKSLSSIILWSLNSLKSAKEISKTQHGCIDCYAAMICAEVGTLGLVSQLPSKPVQSDQKMKKLIEEIPEGEWRSHANGKQESQKRWEILCSVVQCVLGSQPFPPISATLGLSEVEKGRGDVQLAPEVYRVCMANVLISSAQKISASARPAYAQAVIPPIMNFIQTSSASKLRGACFQVLFTSVYHLKGLAIVPFAADLLNLSISTIGGRFSIEERTAGTRLLASLLASEDSVLEKIAPYIEDAQRAVATVANMDSSPQLRALCEQLLGCMTRSD